MKKLLILVVILVIFITSFTIVKADDAKLNLNDAAVQNAAHIYPYLQQTIYTIYCRPDRVVDIEMQPGEKYLYVGGADTVRWEIDPVLLGAQWHILVKPKFDDPALTTDFIIGTDLHVYHIEAFMSKPKFTPIIGWTYPRETRLAFLRNEEAQEQKDNNILLGASLNFNYKIQGKDRSKLPVWTPQMVLDDGQKTYIKMPPEMEFQEAPVLFIKDEEGKLAIVNYRLKNGFFIVDRLIDEAELQSGKKDIVRIIRQK
jgi:P-type conjugative transfer protein TrbG